MAKIHTYTTDGTVSIADKIIGTDGDAGANNATKNFTVGSLQTFMGNQFAPKADFETLQTTVTTNRANVDTAFTNSGTGSTAVTTFDQREIKLTDITNSAGLSTGSITIGREGAVGITLLSNNYNPSNNPNIHTSHGLIRVGKTGNSPTNGDFGNYSLMGDLGGTVSIQNETGPKSTIISLKATSAGNNKTVFAVSSKLPVTPTTAVSTGLGSSIVHNVRVTGKSDLFLGHNSSTHTSNITAKKFTSIANSTYYIEPASGTKINELQANKITPITSGSTSGAASSIFAIPKVSNTQQSGFNASNTQAGVLGQMLFDDNYIYICTQAGSNGSAVWKRAAISTF